MIILLTGQPGAGKTTVLERFLEKYSDCFWILSKELRDEAHERVGFEAVTSTGQRGVFAHKLYIQSDQMIGSYHVNVGVIDQLFSGSINDELKKSNRLLVIDEIGRMEMLSKKFVETIDRMFESDIPLLATIRYEDAWAEKYKNHPQAVVFEITEQNREQLADILVHIFYNQTYFEHLTIVQKGMVLDMLKRYAKDDHLIQIKKLFKNALKYLAEDRLKNIDDHTWEVTGDHRSHWVELQSDKKMTCDCDLFLGQGEFNGMPGECSHIQMVKLSK